MLEQKCLGIGNHVTNYGLRYILLLTQQLAGGYYLWSVRKTDVQWKKFNVWNLSLFRFVRSIKQGRRGRIRRR